MDFLQELGFTDPSTKKLYLKTLIFGGNFSGKTTAALTFPDPMVGDCERSTAMIARQKPRNQITGEELPWAKQITGDRILEVSEPFQLMKVVSELHKNNFLSNPPPEYQTFVIDAWNVWWDSLQAEYADLTGRTNKKLESSKAMFNKDVTRWDEWGKMKGPVHQLLRWMNSAQMHKVYTAHSASNFIKEWKGGKERVKVDGQKVKGDAGLVYHVDIIVELLPIDDERLTGAKKGQPGWAIIHKDRTQVFCKGQWVKDWRFQLYEDFLANNEEMPEKKEETIHYANQKASSLDAGVKLCLGSEELLNWAKALNITDDNLMAGIMKYNADLDIVLSNLRARAKELGVTL